MWTFGKKVAGGFALSFLLLLAIGTVAFRSINSLTRTNELVVHARDVIVHISDLLSLAKDAETGQRGYVITADESYLEPYQAAITRLPVVIQQLRQLTVDNADQQKRLDAVEPLIAAKLAELKQTIDLRKKGDLDQTEKNDTRGAREELDGRHS